ncbi:MAG: DUF1254 domain-containing protein [Deltaproteobacteria bacterium]|nr:DUF1254 domain-containing protein [Deltaproteobacteria bacterium]
MNAIMLIIGWTALTLVLERIFYITGISAYTYYLTDRRLKGFGNYKTPNVLFHGKLLSSASKVVPAPTPHALNSSCIYDVRKHPIRLKAIVPDGVYWSITFFSRNQACYFTLNDMEAREKYGDEVEIVLAKPNSGYQPKGKEIYAESPRLSRIGLILIRTIVMDPSDENGMARVVEIQRKAFVESIDGG